MRSGFWVSLLTACIAAAPSFAADKTLKVIAHADLKVLDPTWTATYITTRFSYTVYDTLFSYNSKYEPTPQMVDRWTISDDKLTWTFVLRDGLTFHDGAPVTTADVIASMKRWMVRIGAGQAFGKFVGSLEAVDAKTFKIVFKEPYGLVLDGLGSAATAFIMPEKQSGKPTGEQITDAVCEVFSFKPADIVAQLNLLRPIYRATTNYGHFGKQGLPWETTNKAAALRALLTR